MIWQYFVALQTIYASLRFPEFEFDKGKKLKFSIFDLFTFIVQSSRLIEFPFVTFFTIAFFAHWTCTCTRRPKISKQAVVYLGGNAREHHSSSFSIIIILNACT